MVFMRYSDNPVLLYVKVVVSLKFFTYELVDPHM
jgi:hypothetical protein